jgi:hypothetical protein
VLIPLARAFDAEVFAADPQPDGPEVTDSFLRLGATFAAELSSN